MWRLFFLPALLLALALPAQSQPVTVFAAASLRDALSHISEQYSDEVTLSFAGSGTLARQIEAGAPADVVILAHRDWANWMDARGLLLEGTRTEVAGGRLVLIGSGAAVPLSHLEAGALIAVLDGGRLAMGQRDSVPAGSYAREWLQHTGAWDAIVPHLAETDNVRAALALVATGAAPLGIVYAADAVADPRVTIVLEAPPAAHSPIRYPAAALTDAGRAFVTHLATPQSAAIFETYGFSP